MHYRLAGETFGNPASRERVNSSGEMRLQIQILYSAVDREAAEAIVTECVDYLQRIATVQGKHLYPYMELASHYQAILNFEGLEDYRSAFEAILESGGVDWLTFGAPSNQQAIWKQKKGNRFLHPAVRWACVSLSRNTLGGTGA